MAHMPEWFAKTPEMMKMDAWYSGLDENGEPDPDELARKYKDALSDLGDAVGKPGQRHGQGIDRLDLRIPFRRNGLRDLLHRRHHMAAAPSRATAAEVNTHRVQLPVGSTSTRSQVSAPHRWSTASTESRDWTNRRSSIEIMIFTQLQLGGFPTC